MRKQLSINKSENNNNNNNSNNRTKLELQEKISLLEQRFERTSTTTSFLPQAHTGGGCGSGGEKNKITECNNNIFPNKSQVLSSSKVFQLLEEEVERRDQQAQQARLQGQQAALTGAMSRSRSSMMSDTESNQTLPTQNFRSHSQSNSRCHPPLHEDVIVNETPSSSHSGVGSGEVCSYNNHNSNSRSQNSHSHRSTVSSKQHQSTITDCIRKRKHREETSRSSSPPPTTTTTNNNSFMVESSNTVSHHSTDAGLVPSLAPTTSSGRGGRKPNQPNKRLKPSVQESSLQKKHHPTHPPQDIATGSRGSGSGSNNSKRSTGSSKKKPKGVQSSNATTTVVSPTLNGSIPSREDLPSISPTTAQHSTNSNCSTTPNSKSVTNNKTSSKKKKENQTLFNYFHSKGNTPNKKQHHNNNSATLVVPVSVENTNSGSMNSPKDNISTELDTLRKENSEMKTTIESQRKELNSIRNTMSIEAVSLRSSLEHQKRDLQDTKAKLDQSTSLLDKASTILSDFIRKQNQRETKEIKQKLASDSVRLGRIMYTRSRSGYKNGVPSSGGMATELWEPGYAKQNLDQRKAELKKQFQSLEERCSSIMNENKRAKIEDTSSSSVVTNDTFSSSLKSNPLHIQETKEYYKIQYAKLKQMEQEIKEDEHIYLQERAAHIRESKRVENEEKSRFKHKPTLNQRYLLLNLLGRGGFSEVWRAYDLKQLREVAVKIHQLDSRWSDAKKENYTKHVSREYEIHVKVRHPRIVSLYDVFEIDSDSFATVLECCKGYKNDNDLDVLLKRRKLLPESEARVILLQILSGMKYLSSPSEDGSRQGIIHYDLKPANILFDEFGYSKITDFGLSKIVDVSDDPTGGGGGDTDSMELTSQGAGTYWYLPPECFVTHQSVRISNKVDVWSLGVIFYQMLFGKRPFGDGQSQENVLLNHTMLNAKTVVFPQEPKVSDMAREFIQACLMHDQVYRPSISELCEHPYLLQEQQQLVQDDH